MKTYLSTVLLLTGLGAAFAASAAERPATTQRERCFQAHVQWMEKPALRNEAACWRVHGYLMGAR